MPNYSSITIIGHACRTPELKQASSGNNYTSFTLAVNSGFGEKKNTSFFDCVFFGKQAETICRYIQKGSALLVEGTPTLEKYTDKDGNNRTAFKITGRNFTFITSSEQPQQQPENNGSGSYTREQFEAEKRKETAEQVNELFGGRQSNSDDLPF